MTKAALFCMICFGLFTSTAFAQNAPFIRGKLVDSLTAEPLLYASIQITAKQTNQVVKGSLSDDKGIFRFDALKKETYLIRVEYLGYKSKIIEEITIGIVFSAHVNAEVARFNN